MDKQVRFNIGYVIIGILAIVLMRDAWVGMNQVQTIPYGEFQHLNDPGRHGRLGGLRHASVPRQPVARVTLTEPDVASISAQLANAAQPSGLPKVA
ncbi:MAG TPA: hypothetical protein VFZ84_23300 [Burkholderiales bacterium]